MKDNFNNTSTSYEQQEDQSARNDSLLGCLLFDAFCGGALGELFAEATDMPQWARALDVDTALDLYEEYRLDRTNGGFELGVNGGLNGMFNRFGVNLSEKAPALPAFDTAVRGMGSFVTAPAPALA